MKNKRALYLEIQRIFFFGCVLLCCWFARVFFFFGSGNRIGCDWPTFIKKEITKYRWHHHRLAPLVFFFPFSCLFGWFIRFSVCVVVACKSRMSLSAPCCFLLLACPFRRTFGGNPIEWQTGRKPNTEKKDVTLWLIYKRLVENK